MGCPHTAAHYHVLQLLHDHGSLTIEAATNLLWPAVVADPLLFPSLATHVIDHGWVKYQAGGATFTLTAEGRDAVLSLDRLWRPASRRSEAAPPRFWGLGRPRALLASPTLGLPTQCSRCRSGALALR